MVCVRMGMCVDNQNLFTIVLFTQARIQVDWRNPRRMGQHERLVERRFFNPGNEIFNFDLAHKGHHR